jgi:predicted RNase H-like HicB family nuclease
MFRLTILGGCWAVGSTAARALAAGDYFSELVIAEKEEEAARRLAV